MGKSPGAAPAGRSRESLDRLLLLDLKLTDFRTDNFLPSILRKLSGFFRPGGVRPHSGHLHKLMIAFIYQLVEPFYFIVPHFHSVH